VAEDRERSGEVRDGVGVLDGGVLGDAGGRPPDRFHLRDVETEGAREVGVALVVVATLAAGVLDPANVRQGVRGLVQHGAEHGDRTDHEAFSPDEYLRQQALTSLPAHGGEMAKLQPARRGAVGPRCQHYDDLRQIGLTVTDRGQGAFKRGDDQRGTDRVDRRGSLGRH
jgi:hypothetical protein